MAQIPESQAQIQTFTHLYNVNGYQACLRHISKYSNKQGTHLNQSVDMENNCREQKRPGAKQRVTMAAEFCSRFLLDRNSVRSRLASNSQSDASLLSTGIISMHHHAQLESFLILVHVNESSWLIYSAGITLREL